MSSEEALATAQECLKVARRKYKEGNKPKAMEWIEKSPLSKKLKRAQLELLKDAIKEPGKIFTSKQVSADFDINEGTARTYLNGLVEEDLLMSSRSKKGKMILYLAPQGLRDKLKI